MPDIYTFFKLLYERTVIGVSVTT